MWSKSFCALRGAKVQKFSFELTPATKILFSNVARQRGEAGTPLKINIYYSGSNGGRSREQTDGRLLQSKIVGVAGRCGENQFSDTIAQQARVFAQQTTTDHRQVCRGATRCASSFIRTKKATFARSLVRIKGLEPPRLSASDPKSDVATNYTISAWLCAQRYEIFFESSNGGRFIQSATSLQV